MDALARFSVEASMLWEKNNNIIITVDANPKEIV